MLWDQSQNHLHLLNSVSFYFVLITLYFNLQSFECNALVNFNVCTTSLSFS